MSSTSTEFNDTYGTTLILIRTKKALVYATDTRGTHGKSFRLVTDDRVKLEKISSTVYAGAAGASSASRNVYKEVGEQYGKKTLGVECTLKEIAEYGLESARQNNPTIKHSVVFIGIENKRPEAYGFDVEDPDTFSVTTWYAMGSGFKNAVNILEEGFNDDLTVEEAVELAERSLTVSAVTDPNTGGNTCVWIFDSNKFEMTPYKSKSILEAYLAYYTLWNDCHKRTIYIFSLGQISDTAVSRWFRSGCLIGVFNVDVVHEIGLAQKYRVRRVVLKNRDASTVIKEVKYQCERYECRAHSPPSSDLITQYSCLSIHNEKCYFAELTKEELSNVCGIKLGTLQCP